MASRCRWRMGERKKTHREARGEINELTAKCQRLRHALAALELAPCGVRLTRLFVRGGKYSAARHGKVELRRIADRELRLTVLARVCREIRLDPTRRTLRGGFRAVELAHLEI